MASIMLVSLCAVVSTSVSAATSSANSTTSKPVSTSVSAATSSNATVQSGLVGAPAGIASSPAVCAASPYDLYLFVKGSDGALWWRHWNSDTLWGAWQSLGGYLTSAPGVTCTEDMGGKDIHVFVRGGDGRLWMKTTANYGNSWLSWSQIGGQLLEDTGPAAYRWFDGRIGVFVTGTDNALYHKYYKNGWSDWQSLGGHLTSSPAAGSSPDSTTKFVNVFVRGTDGALWLESYYGSWSGWKSLGGQIAPGTAPAACAWYHGTDQSFSEHRNDVFVKGTDGALWHRVNIGTAPLGTIANMGTWSGWESLGGYLTSSPAAAASPTCFTYKQIDVFVRGGDNLLWQKTYDNKAKTWSGWKSI